ncbi:MAG: glycosyltransferase family 2 protein [Candidatus Binataceae bacterium]
MLTETAARSPVTAEAKFFSRSGQKFFFKAMRLPEVGASLDFSQKLALRNRLEDLKRAHTTGLIVTEAQSQPVLDIAAQAGMIAMLELKLAPADLFDNRRWSAALSRAAHTAAIYRGHRALCGYIVDCPIPQDELRAEGFMKVRARMRELVRSIKHRDPQVMVALKHRPATRALSLLEEDFLYAEVPALEPVELRDFVVGLHNIAEARPVVVELRDPSPGQDEAVAMAFGTGAAGVVARPVPAPVSHDWLGIRMLRAAELMPFVSLNGSCPPGAPHTPMVSVVVCAYDAERTMRQCLESLTRVVYPNFEVVIVDDGSRDRTAEISMEFPQFRLIRQPNKGLAIARNAGAHAARGEIIAYTDSDCVVDPHWLTLIVRAMQEGGFDGCGGPNYAPHEDGRVEACVAASPGAPCHVLVADNVAEHLAGCNMIFTRAALDAIGGFDPRFTAAGDDVDVCWRMLDRGMRLGYSPAAFVWHFRRNTIAAYYRQQRGYGRAEAMLYESYPERFNALGQIKWTGKIPGFIRTLPGGDEPRVFWGARRTGHQTIFDPALKTLAFMPQTLEWTILWTLAITVSILLGVSAWPALAMLALGPLWALYYAWHAPLEKMHRSFGSRMLIAILAYTGPMRRTLTRYRTRLKLHGRKAFEATPRQRPQLNFSRREFRLAYWNEQHVTRDALLERTMKLFARDGHRAFVDRGWNDYDLELRPDPWTRVELKTADEEHEGAKLKNHIVARVRLSRKSRIGLAAGLIGAGAAAFAVLPGFSMAILALTMTGCACAALALAKAGRYTYRAIEEAAAGINLIPLGTPTRAALITTQAAWRPASIVRGRRRRAAGIAAANQPAID